MEEYSFAVLKMISESESPVLATLVNGPRFSITAFNPWGELHDVSENKNRNKKLRVDLEHLSPISILESHSQNKVDEWREDGFTINFSETSSDTDRLMSEICRKYDHAAIYKFQCVEQG
eukprot:18745_1